MPSAAVPRRVMIAAPRAAPPLDETPQARAASSAFEAELSELSGEAQQRRSVDSFARAALEGFGWAVLAGVCGKLLWDSARPPLFFYPLALLDLLLLWDGARSFLYARRELSRELRLESRVSELRDSLGIDLPPGAPLETGT